MRQLHTRRLPPRTAAGRKNAIVDDSCGCEGSRATSLRRECSLMMCHVDQADKSRRGAPSTAQRWWDRAQVASRSVAESCQLPRAAWSPLPPRENGISPLHPYPSRPACAAFPRPSTCPRMARAMHSTAPGCSFLGQRPGPEEGTQRASHSRQRRACGFERAGAARTAWSAAVARRQACAAPSRCSSTRPAPQRARTGAVRPAAWALAAPAASARGSESSGGTGHRRRHVRGTRVERLCSALLIRLVARLPRFQPSME